MAENQNPPAGPDLNKGVAPAEFTADKLLGHVGEEEVWWCAAAPTSLP